MFQIVVSGLWQSYEELERQLSRRELLIQEAREVLNNLNAFTGMEGVTYNLNKQITTLEEEQTQCIQMLQALNLVLTHYDTCERRIISKCEVGDYRTFKLNIKENDFSHIANTLKEIR